MNDFFYPQLEEAQGVFENPSLAIEEDTFIIE